MSEWLVLLHVAIAFVLVAGLIGRGVTLAMARSSRDIGAVGTLLELGGRFERWMVIPGSAAVLIAGLLAAWAEHLPWTGSGNWWLLTSLLVFLSAGPLVPLVFLPRGKVSRRLSMRRCNEGKSPRSSRRRSATRW